MARQSQREAELPGGRQHRRPVLKSSLSPEQQQLVELMQGVRYGRIEGLHVRNGNPVLTPRPRIVRVVRFGKQNDAHAGLACDDFALRDKVVELIEFFEREGSVYVEELSINDGLPVQMTVVDEQQN